MPALALAVLFSGYTVMWWGYVILRNYDITIQELVIPGRYKGTKWPPPTKKTINPTPFTVPNSSTGDGSTQTV